ncbi:MAG: major facilitator superfamily 1 [Firmicutes bacterium]|nr:major facilitator superfamily 1 [Bacillota bacterium]
MPYRWVVFGLAYLAYFSQFSNYLSWNPFIPFAGEIFGFSIQQSANIVAAVALGRIICQIPGGLLVDRFTPKQILPLSLAVSALCIFFAGWNGSFYSILLSQFLIGCSVVVVWPMSIRLMVDWFPETERDFVAGLLNTGNTLSVAFVSALIPYAYQLQNWRLAFYVLGIIACITTVAALGVMKPSASQGSVVQPKRPISIATIVRLLKDKKFLCGLAIYAGAVSTTWGANAWLVTYLVQGAALPSATASFMMAAFGLCGTISMPVIGLVTKGKTQRRRMVILSNLLMLIILLLSLPWIQNELMLWCLMVVLGVAAFSFMGPVNMLVTDIVEPTLFGSAMAVMIFTWQITSMVQSLLIGFILNNIQAAFSYQLVFGVIVLGAVIAAGAVHVMNRKDIIEI